MDGMGWDFISPGTLGEVHKYPCIFWYIGKFKSFFISLDKFGFVSSVWGYTIEIQFPNLTLLN